MAQRKRKGGWRGPEYPGEFPTLGYLVAEYIEDSVVIPDRAVAGEPFRLTDPQLDYLLWYYRLDPVTCRFRWDRGGTLVAPQKWGKGPFSAAIAIAEADGPVLPAGWDADGEPVGKPWATPRIQITAVSHDQTENVWAALVPMIELGDLRADIPDTGETRINLRGGGQIKPVTAAHRSRLGQRITFAVQDQTESWTERNHGRTLADNQRRNIAGMGGRWLETPNAWNQHHNSVAQQTWENDEPGVYRKMIDAGPGSIRNKRERRRMLRKGYDGHRDDQPGGWINIDRIESEVIALMDRDQAQAEQYFLNRIGSGSDSPVDMAKWKANILDGHEPPDGALVVVGVDGARWDDSLAMIATEVETGHQWVACLLETPPNPPDDYEHDLEEADRAMMALFDRYSVWRAYCDPQRIEKLVDRWRGRWGEKTVIEWFTYRDRAVCYAVRHYVQAIHAGDQTHDDDPRFEAHIRNARKDYRNVYDEEKRRMYTLSKDAPMSPRKMDAAMAGALSWECRSDAIASGAEAGPTESIYETTGFSSL